VKLYNAVRPTCSAERDRNNAMSSADQYAQRSLFCPASTRTVNGSTVFTSRFAASSRAARTRSRQDMCAQSWTSKAYGQTALPCVSTHRGLPPHAPMTSWRRTFAPQHPPPTCGKRVPWGKSPPP
jgi:hypothetical protein